jgi:hypothetical protein
VIGKILRRNLCLAGGLTSHGQHKAGGLRGAPFLAPFARSGAVHHIGPKRLNGSWVTDRRSAFV